MENLPPWMVVLIGMMVGAAVAGSCYLLVMMKLHG
jgi:hypothetical protein